MSGLAPPGPGEPTRIGPYQVLGRLGEGGMGVVYLGQAPNGRRVAIKVLHDEVADDPELRERFRREADAAGRVAGFSTAQVLDADLDGPVPYIASEYVEGSDLHEAVARHGPLPASALESLAVGVAGALVAIHAAGVVHRDLKPSNVLLASTGPRVIDFGVARAADFATGLTATRVQPGTPAFMAPEQHKGYPATPASDVFAWGAVVAFAGTGRLPFGWGGDATVGYRVVHGEPDLAGLPERLLGIVQAAMAKDPAARPSARDVLLHLTGDAAEVRRAATPLTAPAWSSGRRPGQADRRRRRVAVAAGAVLGVVALVAGAVAAWPDREPQAPPQASGASPTTVPNLNGQSGQAKAGGPTQKVRTRPLPAYRPPGSLAGTDPVLRDDFSTREYGWSEDRLDESSGGWESQYFEGAFRIRSANEENVDAFHESSDAWVEAVLRRKDDASLQRYREPTDTRVHLGVDVARRGGDPNGAFAIRCAVYGDFSYWFELAMNGRYEVTRVTGRPPSPKVEVLSQGRVDTLVEDAFNRLEASCAFEPGAPTAKLAMRVNGERVAQLTDTKRPPEAAKDRTIGVYITAYSPGTTPDNEVWFDALFDNYTIWLDDRDTLPPD